MATIYGEITRARVKFIGLHAAHKCERCGHCCTICKSVAILPKEARKISAFLKMPIELFYQKYTTGGSLISEPCVFYDDTAKACTIYPARPSACRIYPFLAAYTHGVPVPRDCPGAVKVLKAIQHANELWKRGQDGSVALPLELRGNLCSYTKYLRTVGISLKVVGDRIEYG